MSTCKKIIFITAILSLFCGTAQNAFPQELKKVYTVILRDTGGKEAWLPYTGEHPIVIIYEDFRNLGDNRELYLKAMKKPELLDKIKLIYISNTRPAWYIPDYFIYRFFREREPMHSRVTFLIDTNRSLQKKWRLLDSDGKSVIILISKEGKIIDIVYHTPGAKGLDRIIESLWSIIDF